MITLTDTPAGVTELRSPYDSDLVELIKQLPGYARRWDMDRMVWAILTEHAEAHVHSLLAAGFAVDYTPRQRRRPPPREKQAALGSWADELLQRVGQDRVEPVHRALIKVGASRPHWDMATTAALTEPHPRAELCKRPTQGMNR